MSRKNSLWAAIAVVASTLFALSAPAHAQATRTWVSGVGNDADPCSRTAPCKTFAGAISKTATNGVINCLDNGGYGTVTITRSMTIDCHETLGSILAGDSTTGIVINIPTGDPKDPLRTVRLRNVDIDGVGIGIQGISILSAAAVILEDMSITGLTKQGLNDARTEGGTSLVVKNSIIANNGGVGMSIAAASPNSAVIDNVHSIRNSFGLAIGKGNNVVVNRSVLSSNVSSGVEADSGAQLALDNSVVSHNMTGITTNGGPVSFANVGHHVQRHRHHRRDHDLRQQPDIRQWCGRNAADGGRRGNVCARPAVAAGRTGNVRKGPSGKRRAGFCVSR